MNRLPRIVRGRVPDAWPNPVADRSQSDPETNPWFARIEAIRATDRSHLDDGSKPFAPPIEAITGAERSHHGRGTKPSARRNQAITGAERSHSLGVVVVRRRQNDGPR